MDQGTKDQARSIYRTVRMLKDRLCNRFELSARSIGEEGARCDITFAQCNALMAIAERVEVSLKELADILHVSPPSASAMVDRLVEMGMLEREQSKLDRREVRIRLSARGTLHYQEMEVQILAYISELLGKLGPAYASQWCDVYAQIREIIQLEETLSSPHTVEEDAVG